jgi:hypothetical protein
MKDENIPCSGTACRAFGDRRSPLQIYFRKNLND